MHPIRRRRLFIVMGLRGQAPHTLPQPRTGIVADLKRHLKGVHSHPPQQLQHTALHIPAPLLLSLSKASPSFLSCYLHGIRVARGVGSRPSFFQKAAGSSLWWWVLEQDQLFQTPTTPGGRRRLRILLPGHGRICVGFGMD